jgi:Protein of unknown function (DUF2934)
MILWLVRGTTIDENSRRLEGVLMAKSTRRTTKLVAIPAPESTTPRRNQPPNPTTTAIAERAYRLYCARGGQHGYDVDDWLQAERELHDEAKSAAA